MTLLRNPSLKCTKENEVIYRIHHRLQRNRLTKKSSSLANATICLSMPCNQLYHAFYTIFWRNKVHLNCEWKTRKWIIHPSWLHLKLGSTEIKLEKIQASAVSIPCLPNTHCTTNWATKPTATNGRHKLESRGELNSFRALYLQFLKLQSTCEGDFFAYLLQRSNKTTHF